MTAAERNALVLEHLPMVKGIARRYAGCLSAAELTQEGVLGLIAAAARFDPNRGVPFHGYARIRVRGAILQAIRQWRRETTLQLTTEPIDSREPSPDAAVLGRQQFDDLIGILQPRDRELFAARFVEGLDHVELAHRAGVRTQSLQKRTMNGYAALRRRWGTSHAA